MIVKGQCRIRSEIIHIDFEYGIGFGIGGNFLDEKWSPNPILPEINWVSYIYSLIVLGKRYRMSYMRTSVIFLCERKPIVHNNIEMHNVDTVLPGVIILKVELQ